MREELLTGFLTELGLWPLKKSGSFNFSLGCLYQESRHKNGYDRRPSATVSFNQGTSWFRCYACGTRRPFVQAVLDLAMTSPSTVGWARLSSKYAELEGTDTSSGGLAVPGKPPERVAARDCMPGLGALFKNEYPKHMVDFLNSKGVSEKTARSFAVSFVPAGHVDEFLQRGEDGKPMPVKSDTIFIPTLIRGKDGQLLCVGGQGRPLDSRGLKYYTMYPHAIGQYLYGQHLAYKLNGASFFLVEGAFDVMHVWQEQSRALGLFGLHANQQRCLRLKNINPTEIKVFLDPDYSGQGAVSKVIKTLEEHGLNASPVTSDKQPKECSAEELDTLLKTQHQAPGV